MQLRLKHSLPVPEKHRLIVRMDKSWSTVKIRSLNGYVPTSGEDDLNYVFNFYKKFFSNRGSIKTYLDYRFSVDCNRDNYDDIYVSKLKGEYVELNFDNLKNPGTCGFWLAVPPSKTEKLNFFKVF